MPDRKSFFDNFADAYDEARRRRIELAECGMSACVEESPYDDGYRVRSIPAAMLTSGLGSSSYYSQRARAKKYDVGGGKKRNHL